MGRKRLRTKGEDEGGYWGGVEDCEHTHTFQK